jgi:hypothetical protein
MLADAGPAGVMRRGQRLGREVDRQQHATAGYIHEPSLKLQRRHGPRINRGTGPAMPATRSPEGGTRAGDTGPPAGRQAPAEENRGPAMT